MTADKVNAEVVPFTNGSAADHWQEINCGRCQRCPASSPFSSEHDEDGGPYDSVKDVRAGRCQLNVRLDMGFFSGSIPAKTAWRIGARPGDLTKSRSGSIYVHLPTRCNEFVAITK